MTKPQYDQAKDAYDSGRTSEEDRALSRIFAEAREPLLQALPKFLDILERQPGLAKYIDEYLDRTVPPNATARESKHDIRLLASVYARETRKKESPTIPGDWTMRAVMPFMLKIARVEKEYVAPVADGWRQRISRRMFHARDDQRHQQFLDALKDSGLGGLCDEVLRKQQEIVGIPRDIDQLLAACADFAARTSAEQVREATRYLQRRSEEQNLTEHGTKSDPLSRLSGSRRDTPQLHPRTIYHPVDLLSHVSRRCGDYHAVEWNVGEGFSNALTLASTKEDAYSKRSAARQFWKRIDDVSEMVTLLSNRVVRARLDGFAAEPEGQALREVLQAFDETKLADAARRAFGQAGPSR